MAISLSDIQGGVEFGINLWKGIEEIRAIKKGYFNPGAIDLTPDRSAPQAEKPQPTGTNGGARTTGVQVPGIAGGWYGPGGAESAASTARGNGIDSKMMLVALGAIVVLALLLKR